MSHGPRPTTIFPSSAGSSMRPSSVYGNSSSQQSSALAARIASKRSELDDLKRLRDVSGALATQMEELEQKLGTLRDGAESVACVMANWDNVLRAINMASTGIAQTGNGNQTKEGEKAATDQQPIPAPLVRIPAEMASTPAPKD